MNYLLFNDFLSLSLSVRLSFSLIHSIFFSTAPQTSVSFIFFGLSLSTNELCASMHWVVDSGNHRWGIHWNNLIKFNITLVPMVVSSHSPLIFLRFSSSFSHLRFNTAWVVLYMAPGIEYVCCLLILHCFSFIIYGFFF